MSKTKINKIKDNYREPKHSTSHRVNSKEPQTTKPKIHIGTARRRNSMKLGERVLVRKKSFLRKGDGMIARRAKQIKETRKDNLKKKKTNSNATCSSTAGSSSNLNVIFYLKNKQTHESIASTNQTRKQWKEKRTQV